MGAAIWSSSIEDMTAYPAAAFARFFANHGLLKLTSRPQWRTVSGGSQEYVQRLTASYAGNIRTGAGVARSCATADGVTIVDERGNRSRHDGVIVAAPADRALGMLDRPSDDERALLGASATGPISSCCMKMRPDAEARQAWASWNYLGRSDASANSDLCVTYWMNALQGLDRRSPLFVTLNPRRCPREA
jgi:predicted NAD/FAD-binding protein